jgi:type II secretory pathway component PulL
LQKEKRDKILNEISEVFKSTFPDKNAVDPYEQMKIEYSKLKAREQNASALITFFEFAQMVSDYVIRIEDFRSEDGEISAELRIANLGSIDSVKNALSQLLDDIKITSTVRSRDGNAFIMRLTGTLKGKSAGKTKMKKEEELENKRGEEKFL